LNTRITVFGVVLIGLWLSVVALGFIPVPPGTLHAPQWVLGAIGAVFVLGGLLAATSSGGRRLRCGLRRIRICGGTGRIRVRRIDRIGLGCLRVAAGVQTSLNHGQIARRFAARKGRIDFFDVL
jgi:hypothetical protein